MFQLNWDRAYKFYSLQESKLECGSVRKTKWLDTFKWKSYLLMWLFEQLFKNSLVVFYLQLSMWIFFTALDGMKDPQLLISTISMQPVKFSNDPET